MEYTEFKQELVSNLQDLIGTRYLVSVQKADFTENLEDFVVIFDSSELVMRCSKMSQSPSGCSRRRSEGQFWYR